jgi:hypothetical protein
MIRDFSNEFLCDKVAVLAKNFLTSCVTTKEIMDNELSEDRVFFQTKFSKGMKISRILGKLLPKSMVHRIQTAFSMLVQKFIVQGTAVISIDPIDYITMSSNRSGWRSCHALDGEYRTGTLAYMEDEVTAIAYVKTSDVSYQDVVRGETVTYSFANKMWRQVVLFPSNSQDKYAIQSRQYPSVSTNNSNAIAELIRDCFGAEDFKTERVSVDSVLQELVSDAETFWDNSLWYNDIRCGAFSTGRLTYPIGFDDAESFLDQGNYSHSIVGVESLYCACGCSHQLEHSEHLFCQSYYDEDYEEE